MRAGHVVQMVPDALCLFPVAQQVVGAVTILAGTFLLIASVQQRIFQGYKRSYAHADFNYNHDLKLAMEISGEDKKQPNLYKDVCENVRKSAKKFARANTSCEFHNQEIVKNIRMIGIGVLRMIPGVGTYISYSRLGDLRKEFYKAEQKEFTDSRMYAPEAPPKSEFYTEERRKLASEKK